MTITIFPDLFAPDFPAQFLLQRYYDSDTILMTSSQNLKLSLPTRCCILSLTTGIDAVNRESVYDKKEIRF